MPRELPIFPLGVVLFPGMPQALHIFEPRYRQLLEDCLAGDRRFGIAYVDGEAGAAEPAPGHVGCVAVIEHTERQPDGRSNIVTVGERRFVIEAWLEADRPYRVARVGEFDDDFEDPDELASLAAGVRQTFLRIHEALAAMAGGQRHEPDLPDEAEQLSFAIAAALDMDPAAKQSLLETRSTAERLERLGPLLTQLVPEVERRAALHRRARRKGRARHDPGLAQEP